VTVAYGSSNSATITGGNSATISLSPTGADRLLICEFVCWDFSGGEGATMTALTFNGVPLTYWGLSGESQIWYLVAPDTGAHNLYIEWDSSPLLAVVGGFTFTGVHQGTPLGTTAVASGTSTSPSCSVTGTSTDNLVLDWCAAGRSSNFTITSAAGQTQRVSQRAIYTSTYLRGAAATKPSTVGTVTTAWTLSASLNWTMMSTEIKHAPATLPLLPLLGVGT
jgi:hypothetical protein